MAEAKDMVVSIHRTEALYDGLEMIARAGELAAPERGDPEEIVAFDDQPLIRVALAPTRQLRSNPPGTVEVAARKARHGQRAQQRRRRLDADGAAAIDGALLRVEQPP